MIESFVKQFDANREVLRERLSKLVIQQYGELVKMVVEILGADDDDGPDPDRITAIDHGDYQGTLLFVIGEKGYQPRNYWTVQIDYGSCSGCDTLQRINDDKPYNQEWPTEEMVQDYMVLALHIVQGLKEI